MSASTIGASERRTEDKRFITGRGQYTDDIRRPYQTHACFLRSPHAHATIKSIDAKKASKMPGVLAIYTGADIANDKVGNLICGWMVLSKDGSPMKAGPHPALAQGKVRYVGDSVAVVIAETLDQAKDAANAIKVDYGVLPAVAELAKASDAGAPQIHENAPRNTIYEWVIGDEAAVDAAIKRAKHVTKIDIVNNRLIPNAIEPRAAIGEYDHGHGILHAVDHEPESARGAPRALGLHRHRAGAQVPRDRARRGRRLRLQDLHLSGRDGLHLGLEEGRAPRALDRGAQRIVPVRRARPRPHHACGTGGRRARQDHGAQGQDARQYRRLYVDVLLGGADVPLCAACCRASTRSRRSIARWTAFTPTLRRSTPIAAPGGRRPAS